MAGCVLLTLNTRLEPATVAYMLEHSEAKVDSSLPDLGGSAALLQCPSCLSDTCPVIRW